MDSGNQRYLRLFRQLPALLPPQLWLTHIEQRNGRLYVSACSEGYSPVMVLRRRLADHALLPDVRWREVRQRDAVRWQFFFGSGLAGGGCRMTLPAAETWRDGAIIKWLLGYALLTVAVMVAGGAWVLLPEKRRLEQVQCAFNAQLPTHGGHRDIALPLQPEKAGAGAGVISRGGAGRVALTTDYAGLERLLSAIAALQGCLGLQALSLKVTPEGLMLDFRLTPANEKEDDNEERPAGA